MARTNRLKSLRKKRRLTQKDVSQVLRASGIRSIHPTRLSRIETGTHKYFAWQRVIRDDVIAELQALEFGPTQQEFQEVLHEKGLALEVLDKKAVPLVARYVAELNQRTIEQGLRSPVPKDVQALVFKHLQELRRAKEKSKGTLASDDLDELGEIR